MLVMNTCLMSRSDPATYTHTCTHTTKVHVDEHAQTGHDSNKLLLLKDSKQEEMDANDAEHEWLRMHLQNSNSNALIHKGSCERTVLLLSRCRIGRPLQIRNQQERGLSSITCQGSALQGQGKQDKA